MGSPDRQEHVLAHLIEVNAVQCWHLNFLDPPPADARLKLHLPRSRMGRSVGAGSREGQYTERCAGS